VPDHVTALLALAAVGVSAGALVAGRPAPSPEGAALLAYGRRTRAAASVALGLPFLACALAARRLAPDEDPVRFWVLVTVAALAFLLLWLARIEVVGVRHRVTGEALEGGSPWVKPVRIPWTEVAHVRWSAANQWFEIEGAGGSTVRVSRWLDGLPALARALDERGLLGAAAGPGVRERLQPLAGSSAPAPTA